MKLGTIYRSMIQNLYDANAQIAKEDIWKRKIYMEKNILSKNLHIPLMIMESDFLVWQQLEISKL